MIEFASGNLLEAEVDALVNPVNCVGVMGKGLALQFKQAFPENYAEYRGACDRGEVVPGTMFVHERSDFLGPRWIVNFPTKRHWRGRSSLDDVAVGLRALADEIVARGIHSLALPAVGCGHGGLLWEDVEPLIHTNLGGLSDKRIVVYPPAEAPPPEQRPLRTPKPKLTLARALYLSLMDSYAVLQADRTLLEVQKLAYFLQEAGQPLRLRFVAHHYGPYAENLNKVLEVLEGHFIRGYTGDRSPNRAIFLLPEAPRAARDFLALEADPVALARLERVTDLIDGFEDPHGLELLSSVHWVATKSSPAATSPEEAHARIVKWSRRKSAVLPRHHVKIAWERLSHQGWLPGVTA